MSRDPRETESHDDDSSQVLSPSEELEAALAEAVASVDERRAKSARSEDPASAAGDTPVEGAGGGSEEVAALKDQLLRLQADFENLRRRTLREKEEAFWYGHENLVKDLLPTVDNLERAVDHVSQAGASDVEGLLEGVELVLRDLRGVLSRHGVEEIEAEGKPFDPSVHEAMVQAPDDAVPVNTVIQVFQRGYLLRDHLLRPARVIVSRPSNGGEVKGQGPAEE